MGARQDSACVRPYLESLDRRREETDNGHSLEIAEGPTHTSTRSRAELEKREGCLRVLWLSGY